MSGWKQDYIKAEDLPSMNDLKATLDQMGFATQRSMIITFGEGGGMKVEQADNQRL